MKVYFVYEQDSCFGIAEKQAFLTYERAKRGFLAQIGGWFLAYAADESLELKQAEMAFYDAEGEDLIEMPDTTEDFEVHGNEVYCSIDKGLDIVMVGLETEEEG